MGAYLRCKLVNPTQAAEADKFLMSLPENQQLLNIKYGVLIISQKDIDYVDNNYKDYVVYKPDTPEEQLKHKLSIMAMLNEQIARCDYKVSGICFDDTGMTDLYFFNLLTSIFVKFNNKFKTKYLASSCAFSLDFDYFSLQNMKDITQNGILLSGKSVNPSKYNKLKKMLQNSLHTPL